MAEHETVTKAEVDAKIVTHKEDASAHHAKYTDAEVDAKITTHKGDASAHHAKTGDNEVYGLLAAGLAAARPAAGTAGRFYYSTDTKVLERDNGASWVEMARGETAIRLAQLAEKAHSSLTGVGASDHHAKTTAGELNLADMAEKAHGSLTGVTSDQHHPQSHNAASHSDIASSGANIDDAVAKKHDRSHDHSLAADGSPIAVAGVPNLPAAKVTSGRFPVDRLPAMTDEKIWKGTGGNVEEVDIPVAVPSGVIVMWHGTIANIPAGYVICDGNNSSPNLLAKFIRQVASAATDPGDTGGSDTVSLTVAQLAVHDHDIKTADQNETDGHTGGRWPTGSETTIPQTGTETASIQNTGSGSAHENKPPFYDIAFIMKT